MLRLIVICLVFLSSGCSRDLLHPVQINASSLSDTHGLLVGSFARDPEGPKYPVQTFYYKNVSTGEKHALRAKVAFDPLGDRTPDDFKLPDSHGALFYFSLPAGEYIFNNFNLFLSNGYFHQNWFSKEDYAIPFVIEPNRVNYVGEIKLTTITGKNMFGMKVPAGGIWVISDQKDRDLELLRAEYPGLRTDNVVDCIPQTKVLFTPLVILPSEMNADKEQAHSEL